MVHVTHRVAHDTHVPCVLCVMHHMRCVLWHATLCVICCLWHAVVSTCAVSHVCRVVFVCVACAVCHVCCVICVVCGMLCVIYNVWCVCLHAYIHTWGCYVSNIF